MTKMTLMGQKRDPNQPRKRMVWSYTKKNTPKNEQKGGYKARTDAPAVSESQKEYNAFMSQFRGLPCAVCGETHWGRYISHGHHLLFKSTHPEHKLNPDNIIPLCPEHHIPFAHGDPEKFMDWLEENLPERFAWVQKNNHHRK